MSWSRIVGHERLIASFRDIVRRGRLAHAYLFVGRDGSAGDGSMPKLYQHRRNDRRRGAADALKEKAPGPSGCTPAEPASASPGKQPYKRSAGAGKRRKR
ncbi:MAG: hypothetical protein U0793_34235 [Gemmataceae bacterium]